MLLVRIRTILYEAQQAPTYPTPRALRPEINKILLDRLDTRIIELSYSLYRNPQFLVKKKDNRHRIINSTVYINAITKRDSLLPPNIDKFIKDVSARPLTLLIDFFSGYDNIILHPESRDITTIITSRGLLRQTTLLQGVTNSVSKFYRAMILVLGHYIPYTAQLYIDNTIVYNDRGNSITKIVLLGVRSAILKYIQRLDTILTDIKRSSIKISGKKSYFLYDSLEVVSYEYRP